MTEVMDVLKEELSHSEYLKVVDVTTKLDEPPFRYSAKRREFTPSDGWFLLEPELDSELDDVEFTEGLMELALRCCEILNENVESVETSEFLEKEPHRRIYKMVFDNLDQTAADAFVVALKESGYSPEVTNSGVENITVTISFAASTDWEHSAETDNINTIYSMVRDYLKGKSPKGVRI